MGSSRRASDEDWSEPTYLLQNYKTSPCGKAKGEKQKCFEGFCNCAGYHGRKDRRRSFEIYKYFCNPCDHVKVGEEWRDPIHCPRGDLCKNCHTRLEQQFHPEVYKSMKCNDWQHGKKGSCPREKFCAFAHCEMEQPAHRRWAVDMREFLPGGLDASPGRTAQYRVRNGYVDIPDSYLDNISPTSSLESSRSNNVNVKKNVNVSNFDINKPHSFDAPALIDLILGTTTEAEIQDEENSEEEDTPTRPHTPLSYAPGNVSFAAVAAGGGRSTVSSPPVVIVDMPDNNDSGELEPDNMAFESASGEETPPELLYSSTSSGNEEVDGEHVFLFWDDDDEPAPAAPPKAPWNKTEPEPSKAPWNKSEPAPPKAPWNKSEPAPPKAPWNKSEPEPSKAPLNMAEPEPSKAPWNMTEPEPSKAPWNKTEPAPLITAPGHEDPAEIVNIIKRNIDLFDHNILDISDNLPLPTKQQYNPTENIQFQPYPTNYQSVFGDVDVVELSSVVRNFEKMMNQYWQNNFGYYQMFNNNKYVDRPAPGFWNPGVHFLDNFQYGYSHIVDEPPPSTFEFRPLYDYTVFSREDTQFLQEMAENKLSVSNVELSKGTGFYPTMHNKSMSCQTLNENAVDTVQCSGVNEYKEKSPEARRQQIQQRPPMQQSKVGYFDYDRNVTDNAGALQNELFFDNRRNGYSPRENGAINGCTSRYDQSPLSSARSQAFSLQMDRTPLPRMGFNQQSGRYLNENPVSGQRSSFDSPRSVNGRAYATPYDMAYQENPFPRNGIQRNQLEEACRRENQRLQAEAYTKERYLRDSQNLCMVCKRVDRPRTVVTFPCGHQTCCDFCCWGVTECPYIYCGATIFNRFQICPTTERRECVDWEESEFNYD